MFPQKFLEASLMRFGGRNEGALTDRDTLSDENFLVDKKALLDTSAL